MHAFIYRFTHIMLHVNVSACGPSMRACKARVVLCCVRGHAFGMRQMGAYVRCVRVHAPNFWGSVHAAITLTIQYGSHFPIKSVFGKCLAASTDTLIICPAACMWCVCTVCVCARRRVCKRVHVQSCMSVFISVRYLRALQPIGPQYAHQKHYNKTLQHISSQHHLCSHTLQTPW